jgi:hypothetical protein
MRLCFGEDMGVGRDPSPLTAVRRTNDVRILGTREAHERNGSGYTKRTHHHNIESIPPSGVAQ